MWFETLDPDENNRMLLVPNDENGGKFHRLFQVVSTPEQSRSPLRTEIDSLTAY